MNDMKFFRNKEIKFFAFILMIISVAAVTAGFMISFITGVFSAIICAVLCSAFFIFTRKRYKKISQLSEQIDTILHGNDNLNIKDYDEGELAILESEIYKMTLRLREQSDNLKQDKLYLADSMANIAHQLRTPLTSINMITAFLSDPDLEKEKRAELTREMETLLSRMDWLLTSLLKMSKIDAGTAIFQKEDIRVCDMLKKAAEPLLIPLEIRNIELSLHCDEAAHFTGDMNWTVEAVGNVIKNCMEHTESGGEITVSSEENTLLTKILIRDTGSGINTGDLPHIFERFYQGNHNKEGSFGVGLALCRMILSMQNATIKAFNHAEGGACFSIRFYKNII